MPIIDAATLQTYLNQVLPGVVAPPHPPASDAKRPDFLSTRDTVVQAERLLDAAFYLRDSLGYTYLSDIAIVDYLDDGLFEIVYHFYHLDGGDSLVLKVRVPRDAPHVPALTPYWPGANFHEREGYDLFGINFLGHPNLKRLYLWDEFEGHPMRKDFPKQGDKYLPE